MLYKTDWNQTYFIFLFAVYQEDTQAFAITTKSNKTHIVKSSFLHPLNKIYYYDCCYLQWYCDCDISILFQGHCPTKMIIDKHAENFILRRTQEDDVINWKESEYIRIYEWIYKHWPFVWQHIIQFSAILITSTEHKAAMVKSYIMTRTNILTGTHQCNILIYVQKQHAKLFVHMVKYGDKFKSNDFDLKGNSSKIPTEQLFSMLHGMHLKKNKLSIISI